MTRIVVLIAVLWVGACVHSGGRPCAKVAMGSGLKGVSDKPPTAAELPARISACMDCSTDPCADFHQYACGGWIGALETPSPMAATGVIEVARHHDRAIDELFVEMVRANAQRQYPPSQFFLSCIDEKGRAGTGLDALAPMLAAIETIEDGATFLKVAGALATVGVVGPFGFRVTGDGAGKNALIIYGAHQGERFEVQSDDKLRAYQVATFAALGESPALAEKRAVALGEIEAALAPRGGDHVPLVVTAERLDAIPELAPLRALVDGAGLPSTTPLLLDRTATSRTVAAIQAITTPFVLRTYLRARVIDAYAPHAAQLEGSYDALEWSATGSNSARETRCRRWTGDLFSAAIDGAFLAKHFDAATRTKATALLDEIVRAFDRRLPQVPWLAGTAAERARARLGRVRRDVGYPDRWLELEAPALGVHHLDNVIALNSAAWKAEAARLGQPIDGIWVAPAHVLNAYYDPLLHAIEMPAAVLQAPLFAGNYPVAYDLGAIGSIMGHELTHAFDLGAWLAGPEAERPGVEVVDARREQEQCIARNYEATMPRPPFSGRGSRIVREAMADLGGLRIAHGALASRTDGGDEGVRGLTREQLFFVAYAQTHCMHPQAEELLARAGDDHPPASFRVNGVLAQMPEFAAAFSCPAGAPMAPAERCTGW